MLVFLSDGSCTPAGGCPLFVREAAAIRADTWIGERIVSQSEPSVVLQLGPLVLSVPALQVEQIVVLPDVFTVPMVPRHCRGVMNVRGQLIPVRDLRLLLGLPSRADEAAAMNLPQRRQDHINWVAELKASVVERREFKLATDPHACAFGRWYDRFETTDTWLQAALAKFDAPHKRLHATAVDVAGKVAAGDAAGAMGLVEHLETNELRELEGLFKDAMRLVEDRYREIAVVLRHDGGVVALTVDTVSAFAALETTEELHELGLNAEARAVVTGLAHWGDPPQPVLRLDTSLTSPLLA
jgi:purine-binding chemotaxis protein CheW